MRPATRARRHRARRGVGVVLPVLLATLALPFPARARVPGPTLPAEELLGDLLMELEQPVVARAGTRRDALDEARRSVATDDHP